MLHIHLGRDFRTGWGDGPDASNLPMPLAVMSR